MTVSLGVASGSEPASEQLPVAGLLALAMTGFIAIMTETLPAGLLPRIADGLGVSDSMAGQLVTAYAAGSLFAAIPLTTATQGWRRRPVLLVAITGFLVFNSITAMSANYAVTLAARFLAGVAAGLAWGIIAGYARRLVSARLQGKALALAMVGTPVALSVGLPAGAFLGSAVGWRSTFAIMSALTLLLIVWVCLELPDLPGMGTHRRLPVRRVFLTQGIRPVLFVILAWMFAHNILYTYIGPLMAPSGLSHRLDVVLLIFGFAALAGIWMIGMLVDRWLRVSVLASLIVFIFVALALLVADSVPVVVYGSVALWGLTFGGAATLLGTASADAAGDGIDVAQAMITTAWNTAIAGGGLVGGALLARFGTAAFPWAVIASLLLALAAAWGAREAGFPPGPRAIMPR